MGSEVSLTAGIQEKRRSPSPLRNRIISQARGFSRISRSIPQSVALFKRIGPSDLNIYFGRAPGDDLLCSTVIHERAIRGTQRIVMLTRHQELFQRNPEVARVVTVKPDEPNEHATRALGLLGRDVVVPHYTERDWENDLDKSPNEHILATMCRKASVTGEINLRPYIFLSEDEIKKGTISSQQVVVQTSGSSALMPMRNKEWFGASFDSVMEVIRKEFQVIQVGSMSDHPLEGAVDLRGRTSVREVAALMANSILFLGLVGFLMHLARAVNIRSVIVYGGRERPWQSGYQCNVNLTGDTPCSPCWRWNTCDYERECMRLVTPAEVIKGTFLQASLYGSPLPVETAII